MCRFELFKLVDVKRKLVFFSIYYLLCCVSICGLASECFTHFVIGWNYLHVTAYLLIALLALLLCISLFICNRRDISIIFFLVIVPVMMCYAMFVSLFSVPDEYTHINRIFDNRQQYPLTVPAQLPPENTYAESYSVIGDWMTNPFDFSYTKETDRAAAGYSVINYFIPSFVVKIGAIFGVNGFFLIFLARIANGTVYALAALFALKKLPFGNILAAVFFLNPLMLQQAASCSADSLCNTACILYIAQFFKMLNIKTGCSLPPKQWILLAVFMVLVVMCKYVYSVLLLSSLFLFFKINSRHTRIILAAVFGLMVLVVLIYIASQYQTRLGQLAFDVNWMMLPASLLNTIQEVGIFNLSQFMGSNLGWPYTHSSGTPTTVMIPIVWIFYMALLVVSFFRIDKKHENRIKLSQRVVIVVLSMINILITYIALWRGDDTPVDWYQSRYTLSPVLFSLLAISPPCSNRISRAINKCPVWIFLTSAALLALISLSFVIVHFWH